MIHIEKMTISQAMPYLEEIARHYELRLHYAREFRLAWRIFANRHYNAPWEAGG